MPVSARPASAARPRRFARGYKAGAWLVSLAVHAGLIGIASLWAWGAIAPDDDADDRPIAVSLVRPAPVALPPEPAEPARQLRAQETPEPEPELVVAALPEPELAPLDDEPRPRAPVADASPEIELALNANWTPRPGSRANTAIGAGSGGSAGAGPRSVSGSGTGALEGTGSGSVPTNEPASGSAPRGMAFVAAELLQHPPPVYPRASLRVSEQGSALLRLHVGADGRVGEVELVESSGSTRLDEAALAGVKAWTFRPATLGGNPIASLELHRVTFRLAEPPH